MPVSQIFHEPLPTGFSMQRHQPAPMPMSHLHGHVEILLPIGCDLTYLTQLGPRIAPNGHICVLWGQIPHRLVDVEGDGDIIIANLPLAELLSWSMPEIFLAQLFAGQLIIGARADQANLSCFSRWHDDFQTGNRALIDVARQELQLCLRRESLQGWRHDEITAMAAPDQSERQAHRVQAMIRFMAENYQQPITVDQVASQAGISKGHAMGLFQKFVMTSINGYLTRLRLHHAQTALVSSNEKVLNIALDSGFGSLSQFYEIFRRETGHTPKIWRQRQP